MHGKSEIVLHYKKRLIFLFSFLVFSFAFFKKIITGHTESCLALQTRNVKYTETSDDDSEMHYADDETLVAVRVCQEFASQKMVSLSGRERSRDHLQLVD